MNKPVSPDTASTTQGLDNLRHCCNIRAGKKEGIALSKKELEEYREQVGLVYT